MDKMIYHTSLYPRQLNMIPQVSDVGYLYNKEEEVRQEFKSCNFSFILRGDGWYLHKGRKLRVIAPSVLIQWPGEQMRYGADVSWDEYFFTYKGSSFNMLKKAGVFEPDNPVISMKSFQKSSALLGEIVQLMKSKVTVFPADKLDLLCWRVICEHLLYNVSIEHLNKNEKKIKEVADRIKSHPLGSYNFEIIAREVGMALPTFRRYWLHYMGVSPVRYIADLKLTMACEFLVESEMQIGLIASEIKFDDALYFSRFFKKKTGLTPKEYRSNHKL